MDIKKHKQIFYLTTFLLLSLNLSADLSSQLLSYWSFDEDLSDKAGFMGTSSTVKDNGEWVGIPSYGEGVLGSCLSLYGSRYVTVADSVDLDNHDEGFTISLWCKDTDLYIGWQALLSKGEKANYRFHRYRNTDEIAFNGGNLVDLNGGNLNDEDWHHIVGVIRPGIGTELWVDGLLVNTSEVVPAPLDSNNALWIGNNPDVPLRNWNGSIDEIAIWGRALDSDEITHITNNVTLSLDALLYVDPNTELVSSLLSDGTVQRTLSLQNIGAADSLTITEVALDPENSDGFVLNSYPTTIAPESSADITLSATPSGSGKQEATLFVTVETDQGPEVRTIDVSINFLDLSLTGGVTFTVYQANRELSEMPILRADQSPNINELRPSINYSDIDKDGIADTGSDGGFGDIAEYNASIDDLDDLYTETYGYLKVDNPGDFQFRLTADDGAVLSLDGNEILSNTGVARDAAVSMDSSIISLTTGIYPFIVQHWTGTGSPELKLEWKEPGETAWELVPAYDSATAQNGTLNEDVTRVIAYGDKYVYFSGEEILNRNWVHAGYDVFTFSGDYEIPYPDEGYPETEDIMVEGTTELFQPQVGGLAFYQMNVYWSLHLHLHLKISMIPQNLTPVLM